jgi:hypothetical protein
MGYNPLQYIVLKLTGTQDFLYYIKVVTEVRWVNKNKQNL